MKYPPTPPRQHLSIEFHASDRSPCGGACGRQYGLRPLYQEDSRTLTRGRPAPVTPEEVTSGPWGRIRRDRLIWNKTPDQSKVEAEAKAPGPFTALSTEPLTSAISCILPVSTDQHYIPHTAQPLYGAFLPRLVYPVSSTTQEHFPNNTSLSDR